jgi:hypothetical protein
MFIMRGCGNLPEAALSVGDRQWCRMKSIFRALIKKWHWHWRKRLRSNGLGAPDALVLLLDVTTRPNACSAATATAMQAPLIKNNAQHVAVVKF